MFGLSLGLHVLPYYVDFSRTGSTGSSESNAISDKLAQVVIGTVFKWLYNTRMEQNG